MFCSIESCTQKADETNINTEAQKLKKIAKLLESSLWHDKEALIIDANVGLGRFKLGIGTDFVKTESAIRHFQNAGVNKALVYSVLSRETDAVEGNALVLEECNKQNFKQARRCFEATPLHKAMNFLC